MKKLYEEFKEYENLWEETEVPETVDPEAESSAEDEEELTIKEQEEKIREELGLSSSVKEALEYWNKHNYKIELEYDGYTDTWEEDRWNPDSYYGHYTVTKSAYHEPYEVSVDPEDALEFVLDSIVWNDEKYITSAYLAKAVKRIQAGLASWQKDLASEVESSAKKFLSDYNKVKEFYEEAYDAADLLATFVVDNLDSFAYYYEPLFAEHFDKDDW